MFKKLLSYFVPVTIEKRKSGVSKDLEVTWNNGELVLDSRNTNYSFGSLQRILRRGLKEIGFGKVAVMDSILVLGVAGGSVIRTLADEIKTSAHITGVDIDPEVLELGRKYFGLGAIQNLEIVVADAFEYVLRTRKTYDLIIIDIFKDTEMPNFLFEYFFASRVAEILTTGGYILFNTMTLNGDHDSRNAVYATHFNSEQFEVRLIPRVEQHNELIVIHKKG
ncbi:MAG: methyltransferase domain-containing protein [Flavobacterium sp.]|nr:MAG: methyltransferase domain-containing protein [Flavobacterium sp.]